MRNKAILLTLILSLCLVLTGCTGRARDHLNTKVDEVELRTKILVQDNIDQVVKDILVRLHERLQEKGITIPEDIGEILVAEAQNLAREYALKGVEIGFDEIHKLINRIFPAPFASE